MKQSYETNPLTIIPQVPAPIRAVVHTGRIETHYLRAGSGPPVLLLLGGGAGQVGVVVDALATSCRVIAPDLPLAVSRSEPGQPPVATSGWIRDLVDGLGLVRPCVIADDAAALPALAFALGDPHRASRLVLATRRPLLDPRAGLALEEVIGRSATPFLLLQLAPGEELSSSSGAVMQMVTFVHSAEPGPNA